MQDYERVVELLVRVAVEVQGELPDDATAIRVHERLGASYWFLGDLDEARRSFTRLLRLDRDHELDRLYYPAELITFFEKEKRWLAEAGLLARPGDGSQGDGPRLTLVREVIERPVPTIAYLMPFGVGQMANGERSKGVLFAVLQGVGLALNAGSWLGVRALEDPESGFVARADQGQAELLSALYWVGTSLFLASYASSVADGLLSRRPAREEMPPELRLIPPEDLPDPDTSGPSPAPLPSLDLHLAPASSGLGLSLRGRF